MRSSTFSTLCINLHLLSACAFTLPSQPTLRKSIAVFSAVEGASETASAPPAVDAAPAAAADAAKPAADPNKNKPNWEVKQHLYNLDGERASVAVGEEPLPMPSTYITCGNCKSLFAIAEADLGDMGKGCRVKCTVCDNSWYQSRERLFDIPNDSHDILPAQKCDLDRIARNLSRDVPPMFMGVGKLYVGNLDFRTTPDELKNFFEEKSDGDVTVCDVSIVKGPDGRSRGFAFVSFYEEADGKKGLACNDQECNGRELSVREPNN